LVQRNGMIREMRNDPMECQCGRVLGERGGGEGVPGYFRCPKLLTLPVMGNKNGFVRFLREYPKMRTQLASLKEQRQAAEQDLRRIKAQAQQTDHDLTSRRDQVIRQSQQTMDKVASELNEEDQRRRSR
jgi:hypothetical protein